MHRFRRQLFAVVITSFFTCLGMAGEPVRSSGPTGTWVSALAFAPDGMPVIGADAGLFRLSEETDQWTKLPTTGGWVIELAVAPDGLMLATFGSSSDVVWYWDRVSFDGGLTWQDSGGLSEGEHVAVAEVAPDGTVWAYSNRGSLLRWDRDRTRWVRHFPALAVGGVQDLTITADGTILAVTRTFGQEYAVVRGSADGSEWSVPLIVDTDLTAIHANAGMVVVGGSRTWTPESSSALMASEDDGLTWQSWLCGTQRGASTCPELSRVDEVAVLDDGSFLVAGTVQPMVGKMYRAPAIGRPWQEVAEYWSYASALEIAPDGAVWFSGAGFVRRSTDFGRTFDSAAHGFVNTEVSALAQVGSTVLAAAGGSGLQASDDGGLCWRHTDVWHASNVIVDDQGTVLVATIDGLRVSVDGGVTFTTMAGTEGWTVEDVAAANGTVCVIRRSEGVKCTLDHGAFWSEGYVGGFALDTVAVGEGGLVFAARRRSNSAQFHRSLDGGLSWQEVDVPVGSIAALGIAPDGKVYVSGGWGSNLAVSGDAGVTWSLIPQPGGTTTTMTFHPKWGVVLGRWWASKATADGGRSWVDLPGPGLSLLFDGTRLLGGSQREGVYVTELSVAPRQSGGRAAP